MTEHIAENTKTGINLKLGRNVIIEPDVTIGENVEIGHNVIICSYVVIGDNCKILDGAILGKLPAKASMSATTGAARELPPLVIGSTTGVRVSRLNAVGDTTSTGRVPCCS